MPASYWVKIALRAAAIFVVGFIIIAVGRQVKNVGRSVVETVSLWSDSLEHGSGPVALRVPFVPLYVNGDRIGKLDTLVVQRHLPGRVDGFRIVIEPGDDVDVAALAECRFRLRGLDNIEPEDFTRLFRCTSDTLGLVRFGEVAFIGFDGEAPLFVSPFDLADAPWVRHGGPSAAVAPAAPGEPGISVEVEGGPTVRVRVNEAETTIRVRVDSAP